MYGGSCLSSSLRSSKDFESAIEGGGACDMREKEVEQSLVWGGHMESRLKQRF